MSMICPQCRLTNCIDCRELECPGKAGFVPAAWQRPLVQITADLARYEALILQADEYFANPGQASNIALVIGREAQAIRLKNKKEGAAVPAAPATEENPFKLT